jgi:hypothetical protein
VATSLDEGADVVLMDLVVGVRLHRPELEHLEGLHVLADPYLPVEHRSARGQLHEDAEEEESRGQQREEGRTGREI